MPSIKSIAVHITTESGEALREWGTSKLKGKNQVSCYIQSQTEMPFRVVVRIEDLTFVKAKTTSTSGEPNGNCDLLASIRFDGQKQVETSSFVYTSERNRHFKWRVTMSDQLVKSSDGTIRRHGWKFKDAGIEVLDLSKMSIKSEADQTAEENECMLNAFQDLSHGDSDDDEPSRLGTIEVKLDRVHIKERSRKRNWLTPSDVAINRIHTDSGSSKHITHRVECDDGKEVQGWHQTFAWDYVDRKEPPYATFRFLYRSEDVLQKFGFVGFPALAQMQDIWSQERKRKTALELTAERTLGNLTTPVKKAKVEEVQREIDDTID